MTATANLQAPMMGWGADFLKKNKESEAKASAAVAAAIAAAEGAAKGGWLRTLTCMRVSGECQDAAAGGFPEHKTRHVGII